jgi:hypothetical protein
MYNNTKIVEILKKLLEVAKDKQSSAQDLFLYSEFTNELFLLSEMTDKRSDFYKIVDRMKFCDNIQVADQIYEEYKNFNNEEKEVILLTTELAAILRPTKNPKKLKTPQYWLGRMTQN